MFLFLLLLKQLNRTLRATARNASPAKLPTTMPMIVEIESLLEDEELELEEVLEAVGSEKPPAAVWVCAPVPFVVLAATLAGLASGE